MKRVFNMQKGITEVTLVLDYEDYVNLMCSIKNLYETTKDKDNTFIKGLKETMDIIESIEPEYIWDEI